MISLVWINQCKELLGDAVPAIGEQVETPKGIATVKKLFFRPDLARNYIVLEHEVVELDESKQVKSVCSYSHTYPFSVEE